MKDILKKLFLSPVIKSALSRGLRKRGGPLYLAVSIHTETIQDVKVFEKLLEFRRALTFPPAAFMMTPACPIIAGEMEKKGVTENVFSERLKALGTVYEIGQHGHYCRRSRGTVSGTKTPSWLVRAGFEATSETPAAVQEQFKAEYEYLTSHGCRPKAYCAGWWQLNSTIVNLLEEFGFDSDCSIRHGYGDSLGGRYLSDDRLPGKGRAFILPPSKRVVEFPSIAYLHSDWAVLLKDLAPMLLNKTGPLFAVLPAHDYNILEDYSKVLANIRLLSGIRNVEFVSFSRMRELAGNADAISAAGRAY